MSVMKSNSRKGIPNKDTQYIVDLCQKHNLCPVEVLINVAKGDYKALGYKQMTIKKVAFGGNLFEEDRITLDHRIDATKKLIDYIYPKRKAVQIETSAEDSAFTLSYSKESLEKKIDENK